MELRANCVEATRRPADADINGFDSFATPRYQLSRCNSDTYASCATNMQLDIFHVTFSLSFPLIIFHVSHQHTFSFPLTVQLFSDQHAMPAADCDINCVKHSHFSRFLRAHGTSTATRVFRAAPLVIMIRGVADARHWAHGHDGGRYLKLLPNACIKLSSQNSTRARCC